MRKAIRTNEVVLKTIDWSPRVRLVSSIIVAGNRKSLVISKQVLNVWPDEGYKTVDKIRLPLSLVYETGEEAYSTLTGRTPTDDVVALIVDGITRASEVDIDNEEARLYRRFNREIDLEKLEAAEHNAQLEALRSERRIARVEARAKRSEEHRAAEAEKLAARLSFDTDEAIRRALGVEMIDVGFTMSIIGGMKND